MSSTRTTIPLSDEDLTELRRIFRQESRCGFDLLTLIPVNGHQVIREFIANFKSAEKDQHDKDQVAKKVFRQRQAVCTHANKKHSQAYQSSITYWDCLDCGKHYTNPTGPN